MENFILILEVFAKLDVVLVVLSYYILTLNLIFFTFQSLNIEEERENHQKREEIATF